MIEVTNLTKKYGDKTAVDDISFTVEKGRIYGFLGPNGAGKTTTLNVITGCLAATGGEIKVGGHDIFEEPEAAKKLIGYLPEVPPLYPDMTPCEQLGFVCELRGVAANDRRQEIGRVCAAAGIEDVKDRLIRFLSKGYRQRVGLACALVGNPPVLILDEPTVGLDPRQIIEMRSLIKKLGKEHTVILSSHILSEVQSVCEWVLIISEGKLVACDTTSNLSQIAAGKGRVDFLLKGDRARARKAVSRVNGISEVRFEEQADGTLKFSFTAASPDDARRRALNALVNSGCDVLSVASGSMSLEDVFLRLTEKESGEGTE